MKNSEVIALFVSGSVPAKGVKANSVSAKDGKLFSYNTIIAQIVGNTIHINNTRYSVTTSKTQGYLRRDASRVFTRIISHDGIARNSYALA